MENGKSYPTQCTQASRKAGHRHRQASTLASSRHAAMHAGNANTHMTITEGSPFTHTHHDGHVPCNVYIHMQLKAVDTSAIRDGNIFFLHWGTM